MMNQDQLLARLNGLEWNDFECKHAQRGVPEDAHKTVSAFANTAGGWIVFGVSEANGQLLVTGVDEPDKVQNEFLSALRSRSSIDILAVEPHHFEIDGKHIFAFHVSELPRNEKPAYLKGDPRQSYIHHHTAMNSAPESALERFIRDGCSRALRWCCARRHPGRRLLRS